MDLEKKGIFVHLRIAVVLSGSVTIFQSLIWIILSCMGISKYLSECPEIDTLDKRNYIGLYIRAYFTGKSCIVRFNSINDELILSGEHVFGWSILYLILSTVWLAISVTLISGVRWDNIKLSYPKIVMWLTITFLISICDLVLGCLFGSDLGKLQSMSEYDHFANIATGILMTIALRGFVLWIINVSCAGFLTYTVMELFKEIKKIQKTNYYPHNSVTRGPISAFDSSMETRTSVWLANANSMERPHLNQTKPPANNNSYTNPAFTRENYPPFNQLPSNPVTRQLSHTPVTTPESKLPPWERPALQREPYTPSPDYSPPPTRTTRSALKPVNNLNYNSNFKR